MADKGIDLRVELPEDPCVIDVDPTRFVQILSNLLHNAAKFTSDDGAVCISVAITQPRSDELPRVSISVVDSGIGISPELLPRVLISLRRERRAPATGPGHRPRILVIDDNQDAANAMAMLVQAMGGDARVAYDGESALEMLQEYQPEVILLDLGMGGLGGYETCQRIRYVLGNRVRLWR